MKILKHGDSEVIRLITEVVQFHCPTCECIFEAGRPEYTSKFRYDLNNIVESGYYTISCPDCHRVVIEPMSDDELLAYKRGDRV